MKVEKARTNEKKIFLGDIQTSDFLMIQTTAL